MHYPRVEFMPLADPPVLIALVDAEPGDGRWTSDHVWTCEEIAALLD